MPGDNRVDEEFDFNIWSLVKLLNICVVCVVGIGKQSITFSAHNLAFSGVWSFFSPCFFFHPDPFADATKGDDRLPAGTEDYIHIRIQQRNGRKTLTTVQGIATDYDKKKLVKAFKKKFACNGTVIEHPEYGEVIQLQGDQRKNICQFLIEIDLAKEEQLKVHGF